MATPLIDRLSPEPFYVQLREVLESQIDDGTFAVGDRLPSEMELCRTYDLARSTVRETLRSMQERGRVKMIPRRGAVVVDSRDQGWPLQVPEGFFEAEMDRRRHNVETKILEAKRSVLPPDPAAALGLGKEPGFMIRRLRRLDGHVALYSVNYLVPECERAIRESSLLTTEGSLNKVLRSAGFVIYGARRTVEAVLATKELSKLLGVAPGNPLLLVTSVSWGRDQRCFDYYTSWLRSEVVKVTIEARARIEDAPRPWVAHRGKQGAASE
jgi:GntR family transcriptional regulator